MTRASPACLVVVPSPRMSSSGKSDGCCSTSRRFCSTVLPARRAAFSASSRSTSASRCATFAAAIHQSSAPTPTSASQSRISCSSSSVRVAHASAWQCHATAGLLYSWFVVARLYQEPRRDEAARASVERRSQPPGAPTTSGACGARTRERQRALRDALLTGASERPHRPLRR